MNVHLPFPYGGYHVGPKRRLTLAVQQVLAGRGRGVHVNIDGSTYVLPFGAVASFEVPADRPVHVAVHRHGEAMKLAWYILMPEQPAELQYRSNGTIRQWAG